MTAPNTKTVYIVQAMTWEYNDEYHYPTGEGDPVKAFRDHARAEAYRLELEQAPPVQSCLSFLFNYAGSYQFDDPLPRMTSLSEAELLERLRAAEASPEVMAAWKEFVEQQIQPEDEEEGY